MESATLPPETVRPTFDAAPALAYVESDAVCEGCGYSLRGQPIRREPATQLALTRCPECGRFAPVNELTTPGRLWLNRFSTFLVWAWLILVGAGILAEALFLYGISLPSMDELIRPYNYYGYNRLGPGAARPVPHRWDEEEYAFLAFMTFLFAAFGFFAVQFAAGAFPHWRTWGYVLFALVRTGVITFAVTLTWTMGWNVPDTLTPLRWAAVWLPFVIGLAVVHGGAGLISAALGRRPLRLAARFFLPRRLRTALAYLWITDGLEPPHAAVRTR
jgi:hypothetical protein